MAATFGRTGLTLPEVIPFLPGTNCENTPLGPPDCSLNTANNDWHLHDFTAEPENAPDGGRAHSGLGSLHLARHVDPDDPERTTYRFRQLTAFVGPPVNLALAGAALAAFGSALAYFDSYRSERLSANLLQAQRDYFGAHTYERVDRPRGEYSHTDWTGHGGDVTARRYDA